MFVALLEIVNGPPLACCLRITQPAPLAVVHIMVDKLEPVKRASAAAEGGTAVLDDEDGYLALVSWKPAPKSHSCGLRAWCMSADSNGRVLGLASGS